MTVPIIDSGAFRIFSFEDGFDLFGSQRTSCYSVIFVLKGGGVFRSEGIDYRFENPAMICLSPYQPYQVSAATPLSGYNLHFHSDFLCVYKHHKEVACNGVLFDSIYRSPILRLKEDEIEKLYPILQQMEDEVRSGGLAQNEVIVSHLKIFLIQATRIKAVAEPDIQVNSSEPVILQNLKQAIEHYYRKEHSASYYSGLLNISTGWLGKVIKNHSGKTLNHLISERIIVEAKRELYLSSKPIKEIAFDLGFDDKYYFSRFFKKHAEISPQMYRKTVGQGKMVGV